MNHLSQIFTAFFFLFPSSNYVLMLETGWMKHKSKKSYPIYDLWYKCFFFASFLTCFLVVFPASRSRFLRNCEFIYELNGFLSRSQQHPNTPLGKQNEMCIKFLNRVSSHRWNSKRSEKGKNCRLLFVADDDDEEPPNLLPLCAALFSKQKVA